MKYVVLLMSEGEMPPWEEQSPEQQQALMEMHYAFDEVCEARDGVRIISAEALQGADAATTVRTRGGEMVVSDGPYAEAVEHLGGFYLIEAPDLDTILELIRTLPPYDMEIRPVGEEV